jgi:hypothetical protein
MGVGGGNPNPPKRGRVAGWSAGAVRRHTRWLYSVHAPDLDGKGYALTLTLRDTPDTAEDWQALRVAWEKRVRRLRGFRRIHWVVEWQRRGTPHLHAAVYFVDGHAHVLGRVLLAWLEVAEPYRPTPTAQHGALIDGPLGWLQYLSKHAARGVRHYQRNGRPEGWETTGRLWGKGGAWPIDDPMTFDLDNRAYWRLRRLVRSWRVADARASGEWHRVALARRMLACNDPRLSSVRGVSDWVPESVMVDLVALVTSEGHHVAQR